MPGTHNMAMGAVFFIGGSVLSFATIAGSGGRIGILFYGAIIVGGIQFTVGLFQWLAYQAKRPESRAVHHAKADVRLLLRSMIAVAAADGELDQGEIIFIQFVSRAVLGEPIEEESIREVFNQMKGHDYLEELAPSASQITTHGAELAVKGAIMVSLSDGKMTAEERLLISSLAAKLGMTGDRMSACMDEATEMYRQLLTETVPRPEQANL